MTMTFCPECREPLSEDANFCPKCGSSVDGIPQKQDDNHREEGLVAVLSFLFLPIGLILYFAWRKSEHEMAVYALKWAVISIVIGIILAVVLPVILGVLMGVLWMSPNVF